MTHAIYIYFIINAFMVGRRWDWSDGYMELSLLALFGAFIFPLKWIIGALYAFYIWLDVKTGIHGYYMYLLTDDFKSVTPKRIEAMKEIYHKNNPSWLVKLIIRAVDKKYNYGITKED